MLRKLHFWQKATYWGASRLIEKSSPLKPFCSFRRTKYDILMEYVSNHLQQSPGQIATLMALREQLVSISVWALGGFCSPCVRLCVNNCLFSCRMWVIVLLSVYFTTCELRSWWSFAVTPWRTWSPPAGLASTKKVKYHWKKRKAATSNYFR